MYYRICDLESATGEKLRRNIQEANAVEGLGIMFSDKAGCWTIRRVHGYSIFAD